MKTTRWGIIGPGNIAHEFVNDLAFVKTPQVLQAVLGHTEENTLKFGKEKNVPQIFTDLDEFIEKAKIDAVYIATPHTLHYEQALACLEKRIPVLCEKPMTINAEQAQELIAAAAANRTFLMEGMWIRFLPSICQVIDMIRKGTIGNIISIRASMSYKASRDPESRYFNPELGGGSLLDLGIYPVFLALQILGKPNAIKAVGKLSDEEIDEACSVLFHYKKGQFAVLESSLVTQTESIAEITGDRGAIKILSPWNEKPEGILLDLYESGKVVYPCKWEGHGFQFEVEEMLECIENNKISSDLLSHQFSLTMIKIIDEIRQQIHVKYDMYE